MAADWPLGCDGAGGTGLGEDATTSSAGATVEAGLGLLAGVTAAAGAAPAVPTFWHSLHRLADFERRQAFLISSSVVFTQPGCQFPAPRIPRKR